MSHTPPPGVPVVPEAQPSTPARPWDLLTAREQEIAKHLANAWSNREIATALGISIKTVDTHRGHIIKKLACKNNAGLARYLIRESIVTP